MLLPALLSFSVHGQIVNTLSPDKTNLYVHALDTIVKLARETTDFNKIYLRGEESIVNKFPDSLDGILLNRLRASDPMEKFKLREQEVIITIRPVSIIRDQFTITFLAARKGGRLGDGVYVCMYKYIPESQTYILRKVKKGIIL